MNDHHPMTEFRLVPHDYPVLSLHQPYASLLMTGHKTMETRAVPYRSLVGRRIAVHAAKSKASIRPGRLGQWEIDQHLRIMTNPRTGQWQHIPYGAILGTISIIAVYPIVDRHNSQPGLVGDGDLDGEGNTLTLITEGVESNGHRYRVAHNLETERPYGDYTPGRYAIQTSRPTPLMVPIPFKGGQGLSRTWTPV